MKILFATDGTKQSDAAMEMLKRFRLGGDDERVADRSHRPTAFNCA